MQCELSTFIFEEECIDSVRRVAVDSSNNQDAPTTVSLPDRSEYRDYGGLDGNGVVAWLQNTFSPVDLVWKRELSTVDRKLSLCRADTEQTYDQAGQQHSYSRHSLSCSHCFFPLSSAICASWPPLG